MRVDFEGRANFLIVYIREAHPEDEWQLEQNLDSGVVFEQPKTFEQRLELAQTFVEMMDVNIPTLVDEISNPVNACYAAWPERMYVISPDGIIVYKGGVGPYGFKPDEVDRFLADYLSGS